MLGAMCCSFLPSVLCHTDAGGETHHVVVAHLPGGSKSNQSFRFRACVPCPACNTLPFLMQTFDLSQIFYWPRYPI